MNKERAVYSKPVLEFATVAREYCVFLENTERYSKIDFLTVASRMLPLLYVKASLLPSLKQILDEPPMTVVDEYIYESIRRGVRRRLTRHDEYLETFKEDQQRSIEPVPANISEDLADIYQDMRDFCEAFSIGVEDIMNDALVRVSDNFRNYWGQRLCNALRAIHNALYSGDDLSDEKAAEDDENITNQTNSDFDDDNL
ncbi:MAG: DUF5063 domain-containing protein [Marinilabiliaceae bacterium]|jgi:hypothetical protein|nr:DUF5063 domain-containing protein [Bacteroidales bacterium]MCR5697622.1 DUF5063 domain-containing protein [Marinilabiliaceae bacterium]